MSAIDLATRTVVANWQVGQSPTFLALDPASHTMYVTCLNRPAFDAYLLSWDGAH